MISLSAAAWTLSEPKAAAILIDHVGQVTNERMYTVSRHFYWTDVSLVGQNDSYYLRYIRA